MTHQFWGKSLVFYVGALLLWGIIDETLASEQLPEFII